MVQYRIVIEGTVQDVGFRLSACAEARQLQLNGWIVNRRDGRVECIIQGREEDCQTFIAWAKTGPTYARVVACRAEREEINEEYHEFRVRRRPFFDILGVDNY